MEKKKIVLMTIVIFVVGLIITGASYAFWSWNSTINKNVVFNTANNLKNYIVYNEGESAFTGELNVSNNYQTGGIHSTISIYKTTNVNLLATIHMDINQIGENMKNSPALKWVVTEGTTSNVGAVLAKGNFIGTKSGDVLTLVPDINVTTTETFYTIWIWLDSSANPSDNLSGETLDTNVWTEINQVEGSEDRYEVTNTTANYQAISATVVDSEYKVTHYAVTTTNSEPTSWTTITPETDQAKVYNLNTTVNNTGTYYIWFKDENGRTKSKEVEVTTVDTSKPSCSWGAFTPVKVANGVTSTVTLTCTDNESGISVHNLQTTDLTPSNNRITISNITKENVTNGYKYTITVTGTTNDGTSHLTLAENKVKNGVNLGNNSTSSGDITVENIISVSDAIVTLEYTSTTYNGSAKTPSVTVTKNGTTLTKDTDYTVTYTNNTNVGTATVTITGINNYGGETTKTFTIAYNSFNITLDNADATTNGTSTIYMRYADGVYLNNTYTTKMTTSANPITIPQRTNYTFLGYYDGTTQMIDATGKITSAFTNTKYSGAKTLNAHWMANNYLNTSTNTYYETLDAAFANVASGQTIQVQKNTTETANATLADTKTNVKLDLYGKTITMGTNYINNNGELDIYNSSSTAAILQGNIADSSYGVIYNKGVLTTNATSSANSIMIQNTSDSSSARVIIVLNNKSVTLNSNTTITFTTKSNDSNRYLILNYGTVTISGATLINTISNGINAGKGIDVQSTNARVLMTSGSIETFGPAIYNRGTGIDNPAVLISGGTITSTRGSAVENSTAGTVLITSGTLNGLNALENSSTGTIQITGGTITGSNYGIINSSTGTITLGTNDGGTPSMTSPVINYPIWMRNSTGTLNFYDGKVISKSGYSAIIDIADNEIVTPNGYGVSKSTTNGVETATLALMHTAKFYYQSNNTSGSTTVTSVNASCIPSSSGGTCTATIPTVVKNSVGTYNNAYAGLSTSTGNMTEDVSASATTVTLSGDTTYYSLYRSNVTIYSPSDISSCTSSQYYRNQWFTSTSAMADPVLSTSTTGTSNSSAPTVVSDYTFSKLTTASSDGGTQYTSIADSVKTNVTTFYMSETKDVSVIFAYCFSGNCDNTASSSISGTQTLYCTGTSTAGLNNGTVNVPNGITSTTGPNGSSYLGLSTAQNSTTITTTINTGTTQYYAVYGGDYTATFTKDNSTVSSIGSTSLSCSSRYTYNGSNYAGTDCVITLPSITPNTGYAVSGWYDSNDNLAGQPNGSKILTDNATFTAKGKQLIAREFMYDNDKTGVECHDVQCMIDYLDKGDQSNTNLKLGDYISYTPSKTSYTTDTSMTGYTSTQTINPSELNLWRVISLNADGTVEIISEHVSSISVYFRGQTGYRNLVGYLNVLAKQYETTGVTVGSRHFGYNGQTEYITDTTYFVNPAPWTCYTGSTSSSCNPKPQDYEAYGGGDTLYQSDYDLINTVLGTRVATTPSSGAATYYWMASRYYVYTSSTYYYWSGRNVNASGSSSNIGLYYCSGSSFSAISYSGSLRPIVTLKSGLSYSGAGTESNPKTIG